jgi:hypothetical protein
MPPTNGYTTNSAIYSCCAGTLFNLAIKRRRVNSRLSWDHRVTTDIISVGIDVEINLFAEHVSLIAVLCAYGKLFFEHEPDGDIVFRLGSLWVGYDGYLILLFFFQILR